MLSEHELKVLAAIELDLTGLADRQAIRRRRRIRSVVFAGLVALSALFVALSVAFAAPLAVCVVAGVVFGICLTSAAHGAVPDVAIWRVRRRARRRWSLRRARPQNH